REAPGGAACQRLAEGRADAVAGQLNLRLLVGREVGEADGGDRVGCKGRVAGDHAAVVAPGESVPRAVGPGLVIQVGGLLKVLVVVDAEGLIGSESGGIVE